MSHVAVPLLVEVRIVRHCKRSVRRPNLRQMSFRNVGRETHLRNDNFVEVRIGLNILVLVKTDHKNPGCRDKEPTCTTLADTESTSCDQWLE